MKRFFGPWRILGIYFSIKIDNTPLKHAAVAVALCIIHPAVAILFYFSKELREGKGTLNKGVEVCVGLGKCLQGFGLLDFGAVVIVGVVWLLLNLPKFLTISQEVFK